ncbi:MAG: hypothetical protein U5K31_00855 [Balneolaceae bacterium]|nr:hypothetical protein [Balneolaceae bacterium]
MSLPFRPPSLLQFLPALLLSGTLAAPLLAQDSGAGTLKLGGYLKELAHISTDNAFKRFRYDNILHHRLESSWSISRALTVQADMRTRLLTGYSIRHGAGLKEYYEHDSGYADLSWVWHSGEQTLIHSNIDRLHLSWFSGDLEVHAGRQRINWGRTYIWNPNDLFNNYAFLDFDYEERPGVDALSAQYNWSYAAGVEGAWRMGRDLEGSVLAGMVRESWGSYDVQFLGGYYRRQIVVGAGWAGYLGQAGMKGEVSWFHPEDELLETAGHLTATVGVDYMLPFGIYLQGEVLYNGGYRRTGEPLARLVRPPTADNLFIARSGWFLNASYQLHPLISSSLGVMGSFDRPLAVIIPQASYSLGENLDLMVLAQLLKGRLFRASLDTQNLFFLRLKYSY